MADQTTISWDWTPFEEPPLNSPEEESGVPLTNVDPRPPRPEVVQLDKSISRLEEQLALLKISRLRVLSDHALINCVPPEILSRIFELGTHENIHLVPILSLVSRHWRQTILCTPTLWSYVRLDHDWNYGRGAEFLRKINMYMQRAQDAKIHVDLDFRYCESIPEARSIMSALQPYLVRCFYLRVSVPDWDWMVIVQEHCQNMNGTLEEIALRIDPGDSEDSAPIALLTGVFPRLTNVVLEQTPLACVFSKAETPSLRCFYLMRDTRYHANQRIRIALREYLAALTATDTLEDSVPELTPVPALTDLAISFLDATNISLLLDAVSLPSLFRLAVQMDTGPEGDNLSWLAHLSAAAQAGRLPALRHLELRACTTDGSALAPIVSALHGIPQLCALGLAAPPSGTVGARLFELLAAGPERIGSWLLPNLRALSLNGCRDVSGHEILRVVCARREGSTSGLEGGVTPIRMVRLAPCYPLDPEVVESLRQNVDELKIMGQV
ncbi:hypothetical protein EW145_g6073 [Phellinidium pouzarii]|uniref:Uncharacterized protein n=1 Tax=Phellinidium pouzarii TaxID=167371 RepID=A0A4S4KXU1_9AGAM|nr:hypothetical protein EW145_g6073 [Phellinidium pouzarii]